jgi:hypothetical protein
MKIEEISKLKEKDHIVLLPKPDYDIKESVEFSFKNVVYIDYEMSDKEADIIIRNVNKKNIQLIIFDYDEFYRLILPYIHKNRKIKWIIKNGLASMTDGAVRATFTNLMEFCDRDLISAVGCLDYGAYKVLENAGYNAKHIILDVKEKQSKQKKTNSIGLIGNDYNPNHNIYNELTAVTMVDYNYIKVLKNMPATKHFIEFFNIKEKEVDSFDKVIKDNFVNLYCNFTLTNSEIVIKSMDLGVPCLLGNTDFFVDYKMLNENLVLVSDDDVNEIANKIEKIKENTEIILNEYKKFRKDYIKKSEKSIKEFLK